MASIKSEVKTQAKVADWINDNFTQKYSFESEKNKLAFTCFDLVIEHHAAIITLCDTAIYGSSYALLRVQYEAFIRGLWLNYVAEDSDLVKFKKDRIPYNFGELVLAVEKELKIESKLLSSIKKKQWSLFNSFTHTGIEALIRRNGTETTGFDNYESEEVIIALRFSGSIAILCAYELAKLKNNKDSINSVSEYWEKYAKNKI